MGFSFVGSKIAEAPGFGKRQKLQIPSANSRRSSKLQLSNRH
jgi:hypothetical protein